MGTIGDIHEGFDPTGKIAVLHVMLEKMRNRLKTLEPSQQRVLMVHFGLNFMEFKTISGTAAYYHLTEKLILEIEKNALETLKCGKWLVTICHQPFTNSQIDL